MQKLIFDNQVETALESVISEMAPNRVIVLTDTNAQHFVLPVLQSTSPIIGSADTIIMDSGDINKTVETATKVWNKLMQLGASRQSVLINLGGGVVTDLGGFVAATYKRGIRFINMPTTLLGAVDAAVGGKTGVNLGALKNQVGVFSEADAVIISTTYFTTLTEQEMLSGYAEMIKHAMLSGPEALARVMKFNVGTPGNDPEGLLQLLRESVQVKADIVAQDPREDGLRKALNFGHTVGHAFESMALSRKSPIPHGYAVAAGMVAETVLSHMLQGFDSNTLHTLATYVRNHYTPYYITCKDYDQLIDYMRQDKKNADPEHINFTLLRAPGDPVINCTATPDEVKTALDIYRDLLGM